MERMHQLFRKLELDDDATFDQVKNAYRDLVKVWHPDRFANDAKLRARAEEKTKELNDTFAELSKFFESRQESDRNSRRKEARSGADTATASASDSPFEFNEVLEEWERESHTTSRRIRSFLWRSLNFFGAPLFVALVIFVCIVQGRPAPRGIVLMVRKILSLIGVG